MGAGGLLVDKDALVAELDGPHVGVGVSPQIEGHLTLALEVQCCLVKPGGGQLVMTGPTNSVLEESLRQMKHFVWDHRIKIMKQLVRMGDLEASCWRLSKMGHNLHVHIRADHDAISNTDYGAAMLISLLSLAIGRRPAADIGVIGQVAFEGTLSPPDVDWHVGLVRMCKEQGVRRIVVGTGTELDNEVQSVADSTGEDGRPMLQFLPYENILDALPVIFGCV